MAIAMQRCKDLRREYQKIWQDKIEEGASGGQAYAAADKLSPEIGAAYQQLFDLLPHPMDLEKGDTNAIEKFFEFLETDILAFRCGYLKSWYCNIVKKIPLKPVHSERVRNLAKTYILWPGDREEYREVCRLAIQHADSSFVREMDAMFDQAEDDVTRRKIWRLMYRILNTRPDLRADASLFKYSPDLYIRWL